MEEKIIQLKVETKGTDKVEDLDKSIKKAEGSTKKLQKETGGVTQQLDKLSGGAISGFRNMTKGVKSATLGFKGLRGAIIATGIGALVVALAALASAFTRNQDQADKLSVFMSKIGAVVNVLLDGLADLGSFLIDAFTNPQQAIKDLWEVIKQNLINRVQGVIDTFGAVGRAIKAVIDLDWGALKDATTDFLSSGQQIYTGVTAEQWSKLGNSIKETGNEIAEAARKAAELQRAENRLRDATIDNIETQANLRRVIEQKRLAAEAEGLAVSEQIKLLKEADQAEQQLLKNRQSLLQQEIAILEQRQQLSKNTADDDRELAQLRANLTELETQSASQRVRLSRRLNSLRKQEENEEKEYFKQLEQLRLANLKDAEEKINQETEIKLREIRERYGKETELEKELIAQRDEQLEELRKAKEAKEDEEREKRQSILNDLEELNALERLDREEQKLLAELDLLKATDDEKLAVIEAFNKKRNEVEEEALNQRLDRERALKDQTIALTADTFGALSNLIGENSKISKKFAIAQALINTYEGITAALKLPFPANIPGVAFASATGFKAVKDIASTNVTNPSASAGSASVVSTSVARQPQFNIQDAAQGNQIADALAEQQDRPIRTYVVSTEVRSNAALDRSIEQSATIG